ncbi:hypothetical protein [Nocardioides humi]|nr:hypothetical protein [Nocardioides humi]
MRTTAYLVEEPGGDFVRADVDLEEPATTRCWSGSSPPGCATPT